MGKAEYNAAWLSWMPRAYSDTVVFLLGARQKGIILDVTAEELQRLSWNDDIYCISTRKPNKHGSVFCRFPITRLYGLNRESVERLRADHPVEEKDPGGDFESHGGKDYLEGGTWSISSSMQDVAQTLLTFWKESPGHKTVFAVGCYKQEWETMSLPWPRLASIKQAKDLRSFDARLFERHAKKSRDKGALIITLAGEYIDPDSCPSFGWPGHVQWAEDYQELPARIVRKQLELFT